MMVCAARLTQRGHTVKDLSDFLALYDKEYTEKTAKVMAQLPHPTIQKFAVINASKATSSRRSTRAWRLIAGYMSTWVAHLSALSNLLRGCVEKVRMRTCVRDDRWGLRSP